MLVPCERLLDAGHLHFVRETLCRTKKTINPLLALVMCIVVGGHVVRNDDIPRGGNQSPARGVFPENGLLPRLHWNDFHLALCQGNLL